jgi:hypothetical protein
MDHIDTKTHGLDVAPARHGRRAQSRSMLWSRIIGNGVYSNSEYSLLRPQGADHIFGNDTSQAFDVEIK